MKTQANTFCRHSSENSAKIRKGMSSEDSIRSIMSGVTTNKQKSKESERGREWEKYSRAGRRYIILSEYFTSVSYTHLDVYKRQ